MIQVTFTPGSSAQAALVGQLMAQYLALDEEPVRTTSGLIAAAQEEAAAPAPKRSRKPATATSADGNLAPSQPAAESASTDPTSAKPAEAEDPKPVAEPSTQEAPAAQTASSPEVLLSLEDVRAKLTAISKAGKASEVKGLLANLGVTNLTSVPKEAYAKLVADAEAL